MQTFNIVHEYVEFIIILFILFSLLLYFFLSELFSIYLFYFLFSLLLLLLLSGQGIELGPKKNVSFPETLPTLLFWGLL